MRSELLFFFHKGAISTFKEHIDSNSSFSTWNIHGAAPLTVGMLTGETLCIRNESDDSKGLGVKLRT
jgi:hypothetical protein